MTGCPCPHDSTLPTMLVVKDVDVEECWAIDLYWRDATRSAIGELVFDAKYQHATRALEHLSHCVGWWARELATAMPVSQFGTADVVCPMPANPEKRPFGVPAALAVAVSEALNRPLDPSLVVKPRPTRQVKFMDGKATKARALASAFAVDGDARGKRVVIVDDVVFSGATLEAVAAALRAAGAARIMALVAAKATKGLN